MKRPAAIFGYALAFVIVWVIMGLVAMLVHAIFAPPPPPKHRVMWIVKP
jgi:hypothetical protein